MSLAESIARALGNGKETRNGDGWLTCCPVHGDQEPSMSIWDKDGSVTVDCKAGCHWKDIKDEMVRMGLLPAWEPERKEGKGSSKQEKKPEPEPPKVEAPVEETESKIWKLAKKYVPYHAKEYFASRAITLDLGPCFRWTSYLDKRDNLQKNVIVAAASKPGDEKVYAVQRLFLDLDENKKDGAKMHGPCDGRAVWFDRKGSKVELLIGEGIETTMSAIQATGMNGAAALSTSGMKNVIIPEETERLYILVDSDPKRDKVAASMPGQRAAYTLAKRFEESRPGRTSYLVSPDDSCFSDAPAKLDFNDLLKADPSGESIRARMEKAARLADLGWKPPGGEEKEGEEGSKPWVADALKNGSVGRFLDTPPPPLDFIFEGSFLAGTTGMMVGPGAAGKTQMALLMLIAVATGRDILPGVFTPTKAGKVIGVFCEDDERVLHHRCRSIIDHLFLHDTDARNLLRENLTIITATGRDVRLIDQTSKNLGESLFFAEILGAIKQAGEVRFIVLDPISRLHGGDENDNAAGTFLVSLVEQVAEESGAATLLLHHVSKRAGVGNAGFDLEAAMSQDAARGASGLTNGVRWQCNLFGLNESSAKKELGVKQAGPGQFLAVKVTKKNYGPPEPVHFLERGKAGILSPVEPIQRGKDPDLNLLVKQFVIDAVFKAEGKQLTKRLLIDSHHPTWKQVDSRITRPLIDQAIANCFLSGELHERSGKNASGKSISYISCYPENRSSDWQEDCFEPEIEPEIFRTGEPEITGENEFPVYNMRKYKDKAEPEILNRRNDALRFASPRNCETVEPEIFSPYGGDYHPSGSTGEGNPPHPVEAMNAEYF